MKVIPVRCVVVRAQHAVEIAAGTLLQIGQQQGGRVGWCGDGFGLPVFQQRDALAALQCEAGNVQCVCRAVAAACASVGGVAFTCVDVAAGIAAQVLQRDHGLAKTGQRGGLQDVALPHGERQRHGTAQRNGGTQAHIGLAQQQRVGETAAIASHAVWQLVVLQIGLG